MNGIELNKNIVFPKGSRYEYHGRYFFLSIKKKGNCLFSRRNGRIGKLIFGYSILLRLFGIVIL